MNGHGLVERIRRAVTGEPQEGPTSVERLRAATGKLHRATVNLVHTASPEAASDDLRRVVTHESAPARLPRAM